MAKQTRKGREKELKILSVEELKKYPGCENLSDEKAKELIDSMVQLCFILVNRKLKNDE